MENGYTALAQFIVLLSTVYCHVRKRYLNKYLVDAPTQ